jgi:hypothetical protein
MVLPPGWAQASDPSSGQAYFYCQETGETRWEPPIITTAAPPTTHRRRPQDETLQWKASKYQDDNEIYLSETKPPLLTRESELSSDFLSPGQIANLSILQQQAPHNLPPYTPLDLDRFQSVTTRPVMEKRRIEIRLHNMTEQLNRISKNKHSTA